MVIDQLTDCPWPFGEPAKISQYSTVSRRWVTRTQRHHFKSVFFSGQRGLEKWRTIIKPDPFGVSQYVRELTWGWVETLEGFDGHIRAFTNVEVATLIGCDILLSPSVVESFSPLGSSLVGLEIEAALTTHSIIAPLLATLPRLRHLRANFLTVLGDRNVTGLPSRVPFFEGANSLDLSIGGDVEEPFNWIPRSARFCDLRIDESSILDESGSVKQWIASSTSTLRFLSVAINPVGRHLKLYGLTSLPDCDFPPGPGSTPLDLSRCTALGSIEFRITRPRSGIFADIVLPSSHLLPPPKIVLVYEGPLSMRTDSQAWEAMGRNLCRMAKQVKTTHPERKMEVEVSVGGWGGEVTVGGWGGKVTADGAGGEGTPGGWGGEVSADGWGGGSNPTSMEWLKSREAMLKLEEDANVVITNQEVR